MLGKLLKYETRATVRWYAPLYIGIVLLSIINKLFMMMTDSIMVSQFLGKYQLLSNVFDFVQGVLVFIYVVTIIGSFVLTFALMVYRFYRNLLGDEGYLMFTLPAKTSEHICSKLIVSVMWIIASAIVAMISLFVVAFNGNFFEFVSDFFRTVSDMFGTADGVQAAFTLLEVVILLLVAMVSTILMMYASMATGHLKQNHRVLYSFAAFIVFNLIMQIAGGTILFIGAAMFSTETLANMMTTSTAPTVVVHVAFIGSILLGSIQALCYYLITNHILSKKLNLE